MYLRFLFLFLFALCCTGCLSTPKSGGNYLEHYPQLEKVRRTNVYTWQEPDVQPPLANVIYLRNVSWQTPNPKAQVFRDNLLPLIERRLRKWLVQNLRGTMVLIGSPDELAALRGQQGTGILVLDFGVTEIKKGNGLLRYLIGFGVGGSILRLEVKGALYANGEEARYREIEGWTEGLSGGNPWYGLNLRCFSAGYCLEYAADNASRMLAEALLKQLQAPPAPAVQQTAAKL